MSRNLIKNPSKKHLIVVTSLFIIGSVLLLLASTDLFTHKPDKSFLVFGFMILGNLFFLITMYNNYKKNVEK